MDKNTPTPAAENTPNPRTATSAPEPQIDPATSSAVHDCEASSQAASPCLRDSVVQNQTPDPCEEDPASINIYLQRARKKTAIAMNRLLDKESTGREVETDRVRNLLAYAAIAKYVKQSNPLSSNGPGRPLQPDGRTLQRAHQMPSNHGGRRPGSGPKRKKRRDDQEESNSSQHEN